MYIYLYNIVKKEVNMGLKNNYKLLSLDLSLSNSGVSVFNSDGYPEYITSISTDSKMDRNKRLKFFGDELNKIMERYSISEVSIEKGFSRYNKSTQAIYQIQGVALYILNSLPIYFYESSSVKKIITDRGNSGKQEVQENILKRYPNIKFDDLDQSDSVAVGIVHLIKKGILKDG